MFELGLVLYELATGGIPHADRAPLEIARAVVGRRIYRPSRSCGQISHCIHLAGHATRLRSGTVTKPELSQLVDSSGSKTA